jgi:hypothetical protein
MKNRSGTYGKTRETLPLEGGGKRVGVKSLTRYALLPLTFTLWSIELNLTPQGKPSPPRGEGR